MRPIGTVPPLDISAGAIATRAHTEPASSPSSMSTVFSATIRPSQCLTPKSNRAEQRQLGAPFDHVPQQDGRKTDSPEYQAQPTQRLKRRQIGILDPVVGGQTIA